MNRNKLFNTTHMNRRSGICFSDTLGAADTGASGAGADNAGGNSGAGGNTGGNQDNPGAGPDLTAFWKEPVVADAGSAGDKPPLASGATGQQENTSQEFTQKLAALDFGPVFTDEIAKQVGEGNLEGANKAFQAQGQKIAKESLIMSAQLMQLHGENLMQKVAAMMDERFGTRDNNSSLAKSFPSYQEEGMKPIIDGIFQQSMKHTKGDRTAAITMTKDMLKFVGKTGRADMGLNDAPGGPGDEGYQNQQQAKDFVAELLSR